MPPISFTKLNPIRAAYAATAEYAQTLKENIEASKDPILWTERNRHINGEPWSYEAAGPRIEYGKNDVQSDRLKRPYLPHIVRNLTRIISVRKPRQSEITENHINKILYYVLTKRCKFHHIFPTDFDAQAISNEKIMTAIQESPRILRFLRGTGAVFRNMFLGGGIYSVGGALKRGEGRGQSRDGLVWDEWDKIPEGIRGPYQKSLSHSQWQFEWFLSTPTTNGVGIDLQFLKGSGYEWFFDCPHCKKGKDQTWSWPENLINCPDWAFDQSARLDLASPKFLKALNGVYFGCRYCGKYIDRNADPYVKSGKWVAARSALIGQHDSYSLVIAMIAWKTAKEILMEWHEYARHPWQFWNEVWGLGHQKTGSRLERGDFLNSHTERHWQMAMHAVPTMRNIVMGIDWGEKESWVVIRANGYDERDPTLSCVVYAECIDSDNLKAVGMTGTDENADVEHVNRAIRLAEIFEAKMIVDDANGMGIDRHKRLRRAFPHKVWGAFWDTQETGSQLKGGKPHQSKQLQANWNNGQHKVTLSQINYVRHLITEYRTGKIVIPSATGDSAEIMEMFVSQHCNLGIQQQWSKEYERDYDVIRVYGAHHLMDADIYAEAANDRIVGMKSGVLGYV